MRQNEIHKFPSVTTLTSYRSRRNYAYVFYRERENVERSFNLTGEINVSASA